MNRKLAAFLTISLACTLVGQARGQEKAPLSDLTLSNFFSEGWDQPWSKRARGDGTPDMSLLRVQTNFLVQLLRIDTFLETGMTAPNSSQSEFVNGTVEYALNRRFMPAIFFSHQWIEGASGSADRDGSAGGLFTRFQLVDRQHDSLAFNLKWRCRIQTSASTPPSGVTRWPDGGTCRPWNSDALAFTGTCNMK